MGGGPPAVSCEPPVGLEAPASRGPYVPAVAPNSREALVYVSETSPKGGSQRNRNLSERQVAKEPGIFATRAETFIDPVLTISTNF